MLPAVSSRRTTIAAVIVFGLIILGLQLLDEEAPEPVAEEPKGDTGMSIAEREAFMRTIGYVQ